MVVVWVTSLALAAGLVMIIIDLACGGHAQLFADTEQEFDSTGTCVLIPYYNEECERLLAAVESLESQKRVAQVHVILVDDGSTNETTSGLKEWMLHDRKHNYQLVEFKDNTGLKGGAMDRGVSSIPVDTKVLVVLDSDTLLHDHAIANGLRKLHSSAKFAAVSGFVVPIVNSDSSLAERMQFHDYACVYAGMRYLQSKAGRVYGVSGPFGLYRMDAVRHVGGWKTWLVEDISWTWRAIALGYQIGYAPDAVGYTYSPQTFSALFLQRRRWARGRVEAFKAAWNVSPVAAFRMLPTLLTWSIYSLLLGISVFGLSIMYKSWILFILYSAIIAVTYVLAAIHRKTGIEERPVRVGSILLGITHQFVLELIISPASFLGLMDELLGRRANWSTR